MNIYFLVEGRRTEIKIYPKWLSYLLPELIEIDDFYDVSENNYYIFSGGGIPNIYNHLKNAIQDVNEVDKYDYFILILDAEEFSVQDRKDEIEQKINKLAFQGIYLKSTTFATIVQNRCIETWFLGNDTLIDNDTLINNGQAKKNLINEYINYYDISTNNPEQMGKYTFNTHAQFHKKYLREILKSKGMRYSEGNIKDVGTKKYFDCICNRNLKNNNELKSFKEFITLCKNLKSEID